MVKEGAALAGYLIGAALGPDAGGSRAGKAQNYRAFHYFKVAVKGDQQEVEQLISRRACYSSSWRFAAWMKAVGDWPSTLRNMLEKAAGLS